MDTETQNIIRQLNDRIRHLEDLVFKDNFSGIYIERKDYQHIGNRLSFYKMPPTTQPQSTGETTGASDIAVTNATTFNGNNGSTAYTILDVVKHLKNLGILKK